MSQALESALAALKVEYEAECAQRDAVNQANAPLELELEQVNAQIEALRPRQSELSAQIDANRGSGAEWHALKRRIGRMANTMMEIRRSLA